MDTVVIVLKQEDYQITRPDLFKPKYHPLNPSSYEERATFLSDYKGLMKYSQNASPDSRKKGYVYPNLTLFERVRGITYSRDLHIAISLPKLLHGHSFDNVYTEQLGEICSRLVQRLRNMGIETTEPALRKGVINTIHYAMNILFPSMEHAVMFLSRMSLVSIGGWFEKHLRDYSNNGHAVRFHSSIFQIVFYLKYSDLFEPKSRSVDRRRTLQEETIAKKLREKGQIPPVIRMEVRFNGIRSVASHLDTVLAVKQPRWTLQEAFDTQICTKVLKYYWQQIVGDMLNYSLMCDFSDADVCRLVQEKYKTGDISEILDGMGMFYMLRALGLKDLREFISLRQSRPTWYRKRRQIASFIKQYAKANPELINVVDKALNEDSQQLTIDLQDNAE